MEFSYFSWFRSFHYSWFCIFLFSSIFLFIFFLPFFIFYLLKLRFSCNCEICQAYMKSQWTVQFTNLCDWHTYLLQNSPTKTIHIHVLNNTITANPDNVEYILKTRFENFLKGKQFSAILGDFLGRGIFNVDGDLWRFQKRMASLELGRVSVRAYAFEILSKEIDSRLIPLLESVSGGKDELDLQGVFRQFSFDVICRFLFGLDPKCFELSLPLSNFALSFDLASKLSAERALNLSPIVWKIKRLLNIGSEQKLRQAIRIVNMLSQEVIRKRRKIGFLNQKDLLSRFMSTSTNIDEKFLRDIVISFLLAGRDTVASTLTSFFRLVAHHPEVEAAMLAEADKIIGKNMELPSYEQIKALHFLHAAIYESLRLYPPVQFDSKFCLKDDLLPDGSFLKYGTRVTYHPYAMGRMEEIWGSDCLEFKPERWLKDGIFLQEDPFRYPVFQAGYRVCLGQEMALVEIKSVAISLLLKFHVKLADSRHTIPRFSPGLTTTFRDGLHVLIRSRSSAQP
ncbi:cytochrome P450 94C1-like [Primulina huaijiensis]|uniref:cytochrome P450 94C1-like n=1 Tax=Primulina huaijiensis TaxID=1492673 RepID=UPI003CC76750